MPQPTQPTTYTVTLTASGASPSPAFPAGGVDPGDKITWTNGYTGINPTLTLTMPTCVAPGGTVSLTSSGQSTSPQTVNANAIKASYTYSWTAPSELAMATQTGTIDVS